MSFSFLISIIFESLLFKILVNNSKFILFKWVLGNVELISFPLRLYMLKFTL